MPEDHSEPEADDPGSVGGCCDGGVFPVTAKLRHKVCVRRTLLTELFRDPVPVIAHCAAGDKDLPGSLGQAHRAHQAGGQAHPALHQGPVPTGGPAFAEKRLSGQGDDRLALAEDISELVVSRLHGQKGDIFPQLCPRPMGRADPGDNGVPTALETEHQGRSDKARCAARRIFTDPSKATVTMITTFANSNPASGKRK